MHYITKTKDRTLSITREQIQGIDWLVLYERERYLPYGHSRYMWSDTRICVTPEELRKLATDHGEGK